MFVQCLCVGCAGFVGAIARLLVGQFCSRWFKSGLPLGTLLINISGSFILGWFVVSVSRGGWLANRVDVETIRLTIAVGFVGSYTTFSTFMLESDSLIAKGAIWPAVIYLLGSLLLGLLAVRAGMWVAEH